MTVFIAQLPLSRVSTRRAVVAFRRREQRRVRRHFADVIAELGATPTPSLTHTQRENRARAFEALATYRRTSRFPRNVDFHDRRAPYFVDARGTRCAVAHLMEESGAVSLMQRIAARQNNAYVRELAPDAEVAAWLASMGLTLEEAARIQPDYCDMGTHAEVCCGEIAPRGALQGVVESIDGEFATVVVSGKTHGTVTNIENGRRVVAISSAVPYGSSLAVNDAVLVVEGIETLTLHVDAKGTVPPPCFGGVDTPMKVTTVLAIADGAECADTIVENEADAWDENWGRCSGCDCGIGGDVGGGGLAIAAAVVAASMRRRWRVRRPLRVSR
jgi:hypothetical protein